MVSRQSGALGRKVSPQVIESEFLYSQPDGPPEALRRGLLLFRPSVTKELCDAAQSPCSNRKCSVNINKDVGQPHVKDMKASNSRKGPAPLENQNDLYRKNCDKMNKSYGKPYVKTTRASNFLTGFTLIEVMAALLIVGGAVVPLLYMRIDSFAAARKAALMQEAMHIAETAINEIYAKGYTFYEEQGYLPEDETGFEIRADFSAEEILLSSLTESEGEADTESEEEKEKEEKIVLIHIKVTVTSKENSDISVSLALDLPADTAEVKGIEAILPDTEKK